MEAERVALLDLADELGVRKQRLFKLVRRLRIETIPRRDVGRRGQVVSTVGKVDALRLRGEVTSTLRRPEGATGGASEVRSQDPDVGLFYLLDLEPEHDQGRIELGFTNDLEDRLRKHRCSAPFLRCVRTWFCRRSWERAAIDSMTMGCQQIHTEVSRAPSVEQVLARGDAFFAPMPHEA